MLQITKAKTQAIATTWAPGPLVGVAIGDAVGALSSFQGRAKEILRVSQHVENVKVILNLSEFKP